MPAELCCSCRKLKDDVRLCDDRLCHACDVENERKLADIRPKQSVVGMGGTENFVHGIYREKIPRYRVYRDTCFVIVGLVTKVKHTQQSN